MALAIATRRCRLRATGPTSGVRGSPVAPANDNSRDLSDKPLYMQKRPPLPDAQERYPAGEDVCSLLSVDEGLGRIVDELKARVATRARSSS